MEKILNIAVVAHVDVGKSTLVDALLEQCGALDKELQTHQIMDSNDLEKERGITIYSKNCSIKYKDYKINIVDTPGHADFSSEVERIIKTVDTVVLMVDSKEGVMPQTRFVLEQALKNNLNPILFINKIDKKDSRIDEVVDMTLICLWNLVLVMNNLIFLFVMVWLRRELLRGNLKILMRIFFHFLIQYLKIQRNMRVMKMILYNFKYHLYHMMII